MSTTLELFWNLSSASKKERIDTSVKLISILEHFQSQFTAQTSSSDEEDQEDDAEDNLETLNAQDVSYSIRRLVRGLASPRESSRLGFAVALTELLSRLNTVTCSQIVSLIFDSSKSQGSMTGQEERDMLFARLFGMSSVIQSGLLVRDAPLPSSSTAGSSLLSYTRVISCLLELGEKKSWLRESAWWTISLAVDVLSDSSVPWKDEALNTTIDALYEDNTGWTPEKIALTLKLQNIRPNQNWNTILGPTFKHADLLDTRNLGTLAKILKESYAVDDEEAVPGTATQTGSWKPQVHFVWDVLLDLLLPGPNSTHASKGSVQEFWRVVVDESLFSSSSSPERKYWGFQIFQKALPRINQTADLPMLFTKNFMRSWINHLSNSDRYLHKAARAVAMDMQNVVQNNPTIGFTLILQLTGVNGSRQFDKLTKTKTVESILLSMNAEGITNYIEYLLGQFNEDASEAQAISSKRSWIISQLGSLIRHSAIPKTDQWIQTILDWFVVHGVFVVVKENRKSAFVGLHRIPKPALSEELRKECKTKLLNSLADLSAQSTAVKSDDDKTTKITGVSSTGEFWISRVLVTIRELQKASKNVTLLYPLEDEDEQGDNVMDKVWQVLEKLKEVHLDKKDGARGVELLLSATLLHCICLNGGNDENSDEDDPSLVALLACMDGASRLFASSTKEKGHKSGTSDEATAEDEPIDLLVDILIGFLEKPSSYLKTVASQSFALLSGCVKESTIDLILTQLEHRDPSHEEGDEYEEMEDLEDMGGDSDSDELSSPSEAEDEDGEDSNDEAPDLELRKKIEEALRANGIEAATGDTDDSDDDDEEDLMDDEQMMAIDEQLAEVFRSRTDEKTGGKDANAQREATHFKNRVLDLVEIYIKRQPTSPYIVRFILPIVQLVVSSTGPDEKQLSDKAAGLLRSRIGKLKEVPAEVNPGDVLSVLQEIHAKARRGRSSEELAMLSQCSMYLVRTLLHVDSSAVLGVYRLSLEDFITRKASHLNNTFFQEFISRHPELAWNLSSDLLVFADPDKAVNSYRQCQALQLISVLLTRLPLKDDHKQQISMYMPKLEDALTSLISAACSQASSSFTAPQLKEVLKTGLTAVRQTKRFLSSAADVWDSGKWNEIHDQLVKSTRFSKSTGLHALCKQVRDQIAGTGNRSSEKKQHAKEGEQGTSKGKRKATEVAGVLDQAETSKKVKRKKSKV